MKKGERFRFSRDGQATKHTRNNIVTADAKHLEQKGHLTCVTMASDSGAGRIKSQSQCGRTTVDSSV